MSNQRDHLSKAEIRKDALQHGAEATINTVGQVGGIIVGAVRDISHAVGDLATEMFEIRDAARKARDEHDDEPPG